MRPDQRIVISGPLTELWDARGPVAAARGLDLGRAAIAELLRRGPVTFVLAHGGRPLEWVGAERTFEVWREVRDRVIPPGASVANDGALRYRASEWAGPATGTLVVLEAVH